MSLAMDKKEILNWLRETDAERLENLWQRADETRRAHVGDAVHLRGRSNRSRRRANFT